MVKREETWSSSHSPTSVCPYVKFSIAGFMQVLFDLFRHDARLWKAYSITLQVCISCSSNDDICSIPNPNMIFKSSFSCCFSHILHLRNTKICLMSWKRSFLLLQVRKINEMRWRYGSSRWHYNASGKYICWGMPPCREQISVKKPISEPASV